MEKNQTNPPLICHSEHGHILIVDDDDGVRESLKLLLEHRGFTVTAARDGEEGLKIIEASNIHIVLCDIVMPKMDGIEFLKRVHEFNSCVEVIMFTGHSDIDNCVESVEKGACEYLIKPARIEKILEAIARAQRNVHEKQEMIKKALGAHKPTKTE
jgi:DNA-binding NtrC family response regulator